MLTPYRNVGGDSGVVAYEIGHSFIRIQFRGSAIVYRYSYDTPGRDHVERMKTLASDGQGLATYISQHVRDRYESKE